jgi:ABC-2 type transport system ATP-binding protein
MRQRLGIARALVNDPVVLFLDEPTLGLDPRGQQELLSLVQRIVRERDAGIVLCSHVLSEAESICDDVVILMAGQVVATGPVEEVMRQVQPNMLRIRVPPADSVEAQHILRTIPQVTSVAFSGEKGGWLGVQVCDAAEVDGSRGAHINNAVLGALIGAGIPILGLESGGSRLQDVFLHLTEESN